MTAESTTTGREERNMDEDMDRMDLKRQTDLLQQQWHGWASPVGLGLGMLGTGGFFYLLAEGLATLSSIN